LLVSGAERGVLREAALAAALLSERDPFRTPRPGTGPRDRRTHRTRSDLVDRVRAIESFAARMPIDDPALDPHPTGAYAVLQAAEQLARLVDRPAVPRPADPDTSLMRALLDAFPDRLARQRPGSQDRGTLVGGRGVRLTFSHIRGEPLFLAIDVQDAGGEADVRIASAIERAWLDEEPLASANLRIAEELLWHPTRKQVEARIQTSWLDLVLDEAPAPIRDGAAAAAILAREAAADLARVVPAAQSAAGGFLARVRWLATALPDLGFPPLDEASLITLLPNLCHGLRSLDELKSTEWLSRLHVLLGHQRVAEVDRLAPTHVEIKDKRHAITYEPGRQPILAVKIQALFGVRETPRIAGGRVPVLLHLLGPNHRPQQVTDDLAGFWERTYPQVRKDLRGRYPKHPWPENPLA
jgi:ATP-dependent helicase HrpB